MLFTEYVCPLGTIKLIVNKAAGCAAEGIPDWAITCPFT
jgi:hypothetical protein